MTLQFCISFVIANAVKQSVDCNKLGEQLMHDAERISQFFFRDSDCFVPRKDASVLHFIRHCERSDAICGLQQIW